MNQLLETVGPKARRPAGKKESVMPVLSKFYGIVIRMVATHFFGARFYATCGDFELVVAISPLTIIQGDAPIRVRELVLAWAGQHQKELMAAWKCCEIGMPPVPIAPLP